MALNQTNKLAWIVETISGAGKITFEELSRRWVENESLSGGEPLLKRTFHKWKYSILDTFGLVIDCEKSAPYRYYIDNSEELHSDSIGNWLLSTCSVSNLLSESRSIKDRIILEDIPSGRIVLESILDAMKRNRFIHFSHLNYSRSDVRPFYVMPLCVKLYRQRWYMVGRVWPAGDDLLFSLDRIRDFRLSSHTFDYPDDFVPQEYFDHCFGIIADRGCKAQDVILKVSDSQSNYLRDLPLMKGADQQEVERTDDYSIFKVHVRPTFDFRQELLWNADTLEVLEPAWLRKEIARTVKRMLDKYNGE